jgi:hypothetical protein
MPRKLWWQGVYKKKKKQKRDDKVRGGDRGGGDGGRREEGKVSSRSNRTKKTAGENCRSDMRATATANQCNVTKEEYKEPEEEHKKKLHAGKDPPEKRK